MSTVSRALLSTLLAALGLVLGATTACSTTRSAEAGPRREPPHEPWRDARPAAGPPAALALPVFQKAELKNGLTVFVVEEHSLPMVEAAVVLRAGTASETSKEAGLAALTFAMLDEGAGGMNHLALANAFGDLGARLEAGVTSEVGSVRVPLLKRHVDRGLELLATVVRRPAFAPADFTRVRAQLVGELRAREGQPAAIAAAIGDALVFGADHPYGHDPQGTLTSLEKLTAARVKRFWAEHAGPKSAALVLTGDITLDEAKALAEKHFGKWSGGSRTPKAPADPPPRTALRLALVDVPGASLTAVRLSRAVMARGDPDEAALLVLNDILAGSFSSRLNLKLREEKQWTYGAHSVADRRRGKGPWVVTAEVETPHTVEAVNEVLWQLDAVRTGGATADEIARAKEGFVKSLPGTLGLPKLQVDAAAVLFAYDLPVDYHAQLADAVNDVTADDVKAVAESVLVRDDFVIVLVGDKAVVEPKLQDLSKLTELKEKGLGEVLVFRRDGSAVDE